MKYTFFICVALLFLIFTGCSKTIDATSKESYKTSINEMKNSLDEEQEKKLEEALTVISFNAIDMKDMLNPDFDAEELGINLMKRLDGKTYENILDEGDRVRLEIEKKKKEQAKIEIDELKLS